MYRVDEHLIISMQINLPSHRLELNLQSVGVSQIES